MKEKTRVYLFFAVTILFNMAANFAHPVTPTIIQNRGFGDYMFGVALASMMVMNFTFSPVWGKLVTNLSSRKIMLICGIGYATGQALFGLASTQWMMVMARMFAGIFTGGVYTAILTYIVNTSSERQRGSYLTANATIGTVASAFGFFVGGMLGEIIGVNSAIIAQVVSIAGCGALFYVVCKDDSTKGLSGLKPIALFRESIPWPLSLQGRSS